MLAEWTLAEDREPISAAVFAALDNPKKSTSMPGVLTRIIVDYLECYACFAKKAQAAYEVPSTL